MDPQWIAAGAAVLLAAAALGKPTRWALRLLLNTHAFLQEWNGTPARDGAAARPGVLASIAHLREEMAQVKAETRPNGGSSLRDAVDGVAADLAEYRVATSTAIEALSGDVAGVRARMESLETQRVVRDRPGGRR